MGIVGGTATHQDHWGRHVTKLVVTCADTNVQSPRDVLITCETNPTVLVCYADGDLIQDSSSQPQDPLVCFSNMMLLSRSWGHTHTHTLEGFIEGLVRWMFSWWLGEAQWTMPSDSTSLPFWMYPPTKSPCLEKGFNQPGLQDTSSLSRVHPTTRTSCELGDMRSPIGSRSPHGNVRDLEAVFNKIWEISSFTLVNKKNYTSWDIW